MAKISDILKIWLCQFCSLFLQFRKNCAGVAAVEFALIAPIMIVLYLGTLEISVAVSVNRKLSRVASVVGDLVAQSSSLNNTEITDIMEVSSDVMTPYRSIVRIRISGIEISNNIGKIVWSCHKDWSKLAVHSRFAVPANIRKDGDFLVVTQIETDYKPLVGWIGYDLSGISFDVSEIIMSEKIFLRPRTNGAITVNCL